MKYPKILGEATISGGVIEFAGPFEATSVRFIAHPDNSDIIYVSTTGQGGYPLDKGVALNLERVDVSELTISGVDNDRLGYYISR